MTWNHMPSIIMNSDSANCKLHNSYDVQSCVLAGVSLLCFYGYRLFKVILFLVGFLMAFFLSYMFCSEYLTEHLSGKSLEYKDQAIIIISSSFLGAFWCINGFDYYLENSKVLYYSVSILHGRYSKSDLPHCWYTWLILSLIPVMFIAGVVGQYFKTAEGSDHREGENWSTLRKTSWRRVENQQTQPTHDAMAGNRT